MTGDRLAHWSLRADAIYCVILGLFVGAAAPFTTTAVGLPVALLIGAGLATIVWGAYVWRASRRHPLRRSTRLVMIANIAASSALALTGIVGGTTVLMIAALVLAIDVAAFAASQGVALRTMPRSAGSAG